MVKFTTLQLVFLLNSKPVDALALIVRLLIYRVLSR